MTRDEKVKYWIESAKNDWVVAGHLFEKRDYPYALFFGHLTVEKLLKALFAKKFNESPPFTHSLTYLVEKMGLTPTAEQLELLEIITDFNLEVRYPDDKFSFYKKCTDQFSKTYMQKIEEKRKWLLQQIQ